PPEAGPKIEARVALNPTDDDRQRETGETFAGFVALAPNMRVTEEFALDVADAPSNVAAPAVGRPLPRMIPARRNRLRRVLILGFRPATVNLIEALVSTEARTEILVIVEDEQELAEALDACEGHSNLVHTGLLEGVRGVFVPHASGTGLACIPGHPGAKPSGHIRFATGDWTSSRQLMK